jgi:toxin ParE1/3/4
LKPSRRYRLTGAAGADIAGILQESDRRFGPRQRLTYAALLERAAELIAEEPQRPGSRDRSILAAGLRSFHVEFAATRRGAAVHCIYYTEVGAKAVGARVVILRVLHERMDPALHLPPLD